MHDFKNESPFTDLRYEFNCILVYTVLSVLQSRYSTFFTATTAYLLASALAQDSKMQGITHILTAHLSL